MTVDGVTARIGDAADPARARIAVDGRPLRLERTVYWIAHKPRGVLTTTRDPEGRRTVLDLLPAGLPRVFPVGRLDWDTEGLVLLTNDGAVAHALLHPSHGSEREYRVTVRGRAADATLARLARGVVLDDGPTAPARVSEVAVDRSGDATSFTLVLHEGRKRQIRRAMEALGHPVLRLVRVRMGPLRLGRLPAGGARALRADEVARLVADARRRLGGTSSHGASAGERKRAGATARGRSQSARGKPRKAPRNRNGSA